MSERSPHRNLKSIIHSHTPVDPYCPRPQLISVNFPRAVVTHQIVTPSLAIILQQRLEVESRIISEVHLLHPVLQTQHQAAGGRLVQLHVAYR